MRIALFPALAGALLTAACASDPALVPGPHLAVSTNSVLPPPLERDAGAGARPYYIGPLDKLNITVFNVPDLSVKAQVDSGGMVSFPLVGTTRAGGKTPDELARELENSLRARFIRDPQVTVNLEETSSQVVTVSGQVREPGLYPVVGRMTLIRTVATAKGLTDVARLRDVVVFRTVGDQKMAAIYNLDAIQRGTYEDPEIFANDVIVVGDSSQRRMFKDILTVAPLLTPLIYIFR